MRQISLFLLYSYMLPIDNRLLGMDVEDPDDPRFEGMEIFRGDVERIRVNAERNGEIEDLRAAIEYHLGHDDAFLEKTFGRELAELMQTESFRPEETLKTILAYIHQTIWPDLPLTNKPPDDVEMVKVPLAEWRNQRRSS